MTIHTDRDSEIIEKYKADLLSGHVFFLAAQSHRSRRGYQPPMPRDWYARVLTTMGKMAAISDPLAQIATAVVSKANLYAPAGDFVAGIYEAAWRAVRDGYDDVMRKASPEPGHPSGWHRPYTLAEVTMAAYWLHAAFTTAVLGTLSGPGWCLAAVAEQCDCILRLPAKGDAEWIKS